MSRARQIQDAARGHGEPRGGGRRNGSRLLVAFLWLAGLVGMATTAARAEVAILPLAEVRPGMEGIGRTVFFGDSISAFPVRILDVLPGARARGSLILFRAEGDLLRHSGIIAGMSGSPVYVDGRLVGAVAFAYPMLKDPIGAITPIEEMLALGRMPVIPPEEAGGAEAGPAGPGASAFEAPPDADPRHADGLFAELWTRFTARPAEGWLPVPATVPAATRARWTAQREEAAAPRGNLRTVDVPLSMHGWDPVLASELGGALRPLGFLAAGAVTPGELDAAAPGAKGREAGAGSPGGGEAGGEPDSAPTRALQPGSAIAVPFISGDASLAAIGSVTVVDGARVIALGHPLLQGGPVSLPFWGARIHSVMPSLDVSFKLGSATSPLGVIQQDRRAGVAGLLGPRPEALPVRVTIRNPDGVSLTYRYGVVRDRILTPMLLPWPVANSWLHTGWAQGDAVAVCRTTVGFNHGSTVRRTDWIRADAPPLQFASAAILPASLLLVNPFERASLDSIGIDLEVERRNAQAYVVDVRCDRPRARVGEEVAVTVTLEPWRRAREEHRFTVRIRPEWAKSRLQVAAGSASAFTEADRDRAPGKYTPRSLDQLVRLVETYPHDGSLILRIFAPGEGSLVDGRELPRLPPSIARAATEAGGRAVIRATSERLLEETALETSWALRGRETTELEVIP